MSEWKLAVVRWGEYDLISSTLFKATCMVLPIKKSMAVLDSMNIEWTSIQAIGAVYGLLDNICNKWKLWLLECGLHW